MTKLPRLGIFGVLNYEKLSKMSSDKRSDFIKKSVNELILKKAKSDNPITIEENIIYQVSVEYDVRDIHYNLRGRMLAVLTCQREGAGLNIEPKFVKYKSVVKI